MTIKKLSTVYDDFINTRQYLKPIDFPDYLTEEDVTEDVLGGYFYQNQGCYILVLRKSDTNLLSPKFYLIIERDEYESDDLTNLENILFMDFAMGEFDLMNTREPVHNIK